MIAACILCVLISSWHTHGSFFTHQPNQTLVVLSMPDILCLLLDTSLSLSPAGAPLPAVLPQLLLPGVPSA
jgi:hypothetical protein